MIALAAWRFASEAQAQDAEIQQACVSAYERAGEQRKIFKDPLRSKAEAEKCAKTCPEALAIECRGWIKEEDAKLARVEITISLPGAKVEVDGQVRAERMIELNPGEHDLLVSAAGRVPHAAKLQLAAGAREKLVIDLKPIPRAETIQNETASSDTVIGGVVTLSFGLAALSAAGVLATLGHVQASDLRSSCAPSCGPEGVATIEREWIAGGVCAGVGLGAAVTGLVLILLPEAPVPVRPAAFSAPGATGVAFETWF